ncbi:DNA alkylation repair protein [Thermobifida halotolerans]|uniref:DNA alkylation repair protein n=2 Tax=Thermobifida halotolerans TaxID=483545 RepID=A0A399G2C7_9ACTN|nr:DNA alkylation repair protein [Thermobifida halotolerans]UOE19860.1 DNA alkylation repair protein [Thermobifida halotolerans]
MPAHLGLIAAVRDRLRGAADPVRAESMRRYFKSEMPFHGVPTADRRRLFVDIFATCPLGDFETWEDTVRTLWRVASHREERYAAVELTGYRRYAVHQVPEAVPLYEELIVAGAWWDYVDPIAINRIGPLLRAYPRELRPRVSGWALAGDRWLRRTAILCQLRSGEATDVDLLLDCVEPNLPHPDFFVRKAIGWALREYAKTDSGRVVKFVEEHRDQMSPLSLREALRNLG